MADDAGGDILVLLLDTNLFHNIQGGQDGRKDEPLDLSPKALLEQVLYFVGAYRLLHDNNQIAVFAVGGSTCDPIYMLLGEETPGTSSNNPYKSIKDGLLQAMQKERAAPTAPMALSGALSRALCLIHRINPSPARTRVLAKPHILCLSGSPDVPLQYVPVMNAIFSAQRAEVAIDALVLHPQHSGFLQQAAHLTGGLYFRPAQRSVALQYLVQSLSADTHTRSLLSIYQPQGVDFRAACFCHKNAIDIGFVCSVCLSIFCKPAPSCFICGTAFPLRRKAGQGPGSVPAA